MFSKALSFTGLVSVASAHILMTNPVPYGGIDNGPLFADGSNFPCKSVAYNANGISNTYAQGSSQTLSFKGTAVHGGGSCQVSVTTDLAPTRDSVWKVIHSIEGGCPARDTPGNIGDNAETPVPFTYDFQIPSDLAAGEYTLAWTWFNKVGNREMYMNCAPVTVTGSGGSQTFLNDLPDMFTANIGNGCTTTEGTDLEFPNPGNSVEFGNSGVSAFGGPSGNCPAGGSTPVAPPSAPVEAPVEAPVQPPVEAPVQPPVEAPVEAPAAPAPAPVTGGQAPGTACAPEGDFNCIDGSNFQRCASGVWSPLMPVAAGTTCVPGQGATLNFAKRSRTFARRAMAIRA
ncbi:hypothetical protein B0I35DRAFT_478954 [Stachybotrys elegans]|uniref:Chitin-binding type-4 domain-containing protein n=1 Tax=Stachybotrys elegans TaxID=80388 RepID=A0A8K0SUT4_9HYPO|nr:hypothetical protein B0I35DRAFT_478954 [Stachybotrys elegans]